MLQGYTYGVPLLRRRRVVRRSLIRHKKRYRFAPDTGRDTALRLTRLRVAYDKVRAPCLIRLALSAAPSRPRVQIVYCVFVRPTLFRARRECCSVTRDLV